ncbi:hypothetical protein DQ393_27165 [Rhizobium tropici]|uniref:Uncharacterized protein n=1 Tax=Rhizobium tropici TaxID=398 RepID=A0A329Y5D2_RHITR|nr:hypothetical protein DQ393_27165 [Rhizobium tropici]
MGEERAYLSALPVSFWRSDISLPDNKAVMKAESLYHLPTDTCADFRQRHRVFPTGMRSQYRLVELKIIVSNGWIMPLHR